MQIDQRESDRETHGAPGGPGGVPRCGWWSSGSPAERAPSGERRSGEGWRGCELVDPAEKPGRGPV